MWQKWTTSQTHRLHQRIRVNLDASVRRSKTVIEMNGNQLTGVYALDIGYHGLKSYLEKSKAVLSVSPSCIICKEAVPRDGVNALVCTHECCNAVGHLACVASHFLSEDDSNLIPAEGRCPSCNAELQWVDLVKGLTIRMRSPQEVEKILKAKKAQGRQNLDRNCEACDTDIEAFESEDEAVNEDHLTEDWNYMSDDSSIDIDDVLLKSDMRPGSRHLGKARSMFVMPLKPVVEDSDWDEAEVIS